jgi:HSP20 family protein
MTMLSRFSDWNGLPRFAFPDVSRGMPFHDLRRELDRLFFDFERGAAEPGAGPTLNVEDRGDAILLRAELPGMSEKELELTVTGSTVTLKGERKVEAPAGYTTHRNERSTFRFARTFELGTKIDPDKVQASLTNGILTVTLPKAADAQPKQIQVKASS